MGDKGHRKEDKKKKKVVPKLSYPEMQAQKREEENRSYLKPNSKHK